MAIMNAENSDLSSLFVFKLTKEKILFLLNTFYSSITQRNMVCGTNTSAEGEAVVPVMCLGHHEVRGV